MNIGDWLMLNKSAKIFFRTIGSLTILLLVGYFCYVMGRGHQKFINLSTKTYYLEHFFSLLDDLVTQKKYEKLSYAIKTFNREWKKDLQSENNMKKVINNIKIKLESSKLDIKDQNSQHQRNPL